MLQLKRKSAIENDRPKNKSCKCNNSYLEFTFILYNGEEKPQCVICSKLLASASMLPNKLITSAICEQTRNFFSWKVNDLKWQVSTISQLIQLPPRA